MSTPAIVAQYMEQQVMKRKELCQEDVVHEIRKQFGPSFTYTNENGNPAIDPKVLKEFK